jgi:DNA-binding PadR family transcriptional regulator
MLQYALLWLLHEQPDYGYRLKRRFEERMSGVWLLNIGQVYQTLQRLQRNGLVCLVEPLEPELHVVRRLFALSPRGERVLGRWLRRPPTRPRPVRDENLVRLLIVGAGRPNEMVSQIRDQEESCRRHLTRLRAQKVRAASQNQSGPVMHQLALEAELLHAEAHLKWLQCCRERLDQTDMARSDAAIA